MKQPSKWSIERARKAIPCGFGACSNWDAPGRIICRNHERVALALDEERERAAKVADARVESFKVDGGGVDTGRIWSSATAREIAAAIRAGGGA